MCRLAHRSAHFDNFRFVSVIFVVYVTDVLIGAYRVFRYATADV